SARFAALAEAGGGANDPAKGIASLLRPRKGPADSRPHAAHGQGRALALHLNAPGHLRSPVAWHIYRRAHRGLRCVRCRTAVTLATVAGSVCRFRGLARRLAIASCNLPTSCLPA